MKYLKYPFLLSAFFILVSNTMEAQNKLPIAWSGKVVQYDGRVKAYVMPERILWKNVDNGASLTGENNLLEKGNGQAELANSHLCHLRNGEKGHVSLLLDFGRELQGGIQLVTGFSATKSVKVHICFGESASEAMSNIDGKNGASNDHAVRDMDISLPWLGVYEYGNTGFRFVRIDLLGENADLMLKEVRACFVYRDIPYKGSFQCDNDRLNKIWMTGAYTVHLNMQDYLWDGIKRDRLVWVGDMYPEVMTICSVFGNNEVVPKSLDLARDETPMNNWMEGYSSYSMWWLLIQYQWYYHNGDFKYLQAQKTYIFSLLEKLIARIGKDGKENLDGGRFLDWPSSDNKQGIDAGLQALMIMTINKGRELALDLGNNLLADKCEKAIIKMREHVPSCNNLKQAAALMSLAGLMDAKKANRDVIAVDGAKDFSTFYGYYMLDAMAKAGDYEGAMDIISQYWGAMLDLGATTFWEDFNMKWLPDAARIDELVPDGKIDIHKCYGDYCYKGYRHSFCHGWASGPTAWLSEYVLGVKILSPGCKKVLIEPHLGKLKWVKGTYPTPYGVITIEHHKNIDGKIVSNISAPKEIKIIKATY